MDPITAQEIIEIIEERYAELITQSLGEQSIDNLEARMNEIEIILRKIDTGV